MILTRMLISSTVSDIKGYQTLTINMVHISNFQRRSSDIILQAPLAKGRAPGTVKTIQSSTSGVTRRPCLERKCMEHSRTTKTIEHSHSMYNIELCPGRYYVNFLLYCFCHVTLLSLLRSMSMIQVGHATRPVQTYCEPTCPENLLTKMVRI